MTEHAEMDLISPTFWTNLYILGSFMSESFLVPNAVTT